MGQLLITTFAITRDGQTCVWCDALVIEEGPEHHPLGWTSWVHADTYSRVCNRPTELP